MPEENNAGIHTDDNGYESREEIIHPLKKIALVLFTPRRVFESLKVKSSHWDWILPLALMAIISLVIINVGSDYLKNDQKTAIENRIEKSTRLSEEQKAEQLRRITEGLEKTVGIQRVIITTMSAAGPFLSTLVIALIVWVMAHHMQKSDILFGNTYRICALSYIVTVPATIIKFPLIVYHESFTAAKTSLGLLLPESMEEGFLYSFLDSIDIFTIWIIILIGIGITAVTKFSLKKSVYPVFGMFIVFKILTVTVSSALQGIGQ